MRLSFGSVAVQPQNRDQIQKMSEIAYTTRNITASRFGGESVHLRASLAQDTVTFSCAEANPAKQKVVDSVMQSFLRKAGIPFRQV